MPPRPRRTRSRVVHRPAGPVVSSVLALMVAALACLTLVVVVAPSASARLGHGFQECLDQGYEQSGETPTTCLRQDGVWVPVYDDDLGPSTVGDGPPAGFVLLFVFAALGAVGLFAWRVVTARSIARESGMDVGRATTMAVLTDDGLESTYLAASLRPPPEAGAPAAPVAAPSAEDTAARLARLDALRADGVITDEEHARQRRAILDAL